MANERQQKDLFLLACARGLLEDVTDLLATGVQPSVCDKDKRNGAHFAAARGELDILQLLHSKGVDIDAEDASGRSPLHYAALHDHEAAVAFLAEKGAWLDACDGTDCSALHLAARGGSPATACRLVKLGAKAHLRNKWELTAVGEAVCRGKTKVCVALAREGVVTAEDLTARVNGGFTLLHIATATGHARAVEWLLQQAPLAADTPAAVNDAANAERLTPLHCLALAGKFSMPVIEKLIKAGADLSARDVRDRTPIAMLQAADASPELINGVMDSSADDMHRVMAALAPKKSMFNRASPRTAAVKDAVPTPAAAAELATGRHGPQALHADESLSVAARLQLAASPEQIASVLHSVPRKEQVHRVKVWAQLTPEEIKELQGVSRRSKQSLEQVRDCTRAGNRRHAEGCLRRDQQFQEAMRAPAVRGIVDAVVADPQKGPLVRERDALMCLNKMRGLRDVLSLNGGGQINLSEVLRPWGDEDTQHAAGMAAELEGCIEKALDALCNPQPQDDDMEQAPQPEDHRRSLPRRVQTVSEIQPAPPRKRVSSASSGWESDASTPQAQVPQSIWKKTIQKILQQLVVAAVLLVVFWTQGKLPYQLKREEAAASGTLAGTQANGA